MGVKVLAGLNRGDVGTQLEARQHKIDTNRLRVHAHGDGDGDGDGW